MLNGMKQWDFVFTITWLLQLVVFLMMKHEFGTFYPGNDDGDYTMIGEGEGAGYNINVPWENGRCRDADYLAVWDHILIPVAKHFNPGMIIVSAGFDAAIADPLGGCRVSPYGYSIMLKQLMTFAGGKIVLALEGGYNLTSIANSALACIEVLLDDKAVEGSAEAYPFESTWRVIQAVRKELKTFWPVLVEDLPTKLTSQKTPILILASSSVSDGEVEKEPVTSSGNIEQLLENVIQPLSTLKVGEGEAKEYTVFSSWRSELSKVDVCYAAFGSNLWKPRFLCYIEGGQIVIISNQTMSLLMWMECKGHVSAQWTGAHQKKSCGRLFLTVCSLVGNQHGRGE